MRGLLSVAVTCFVLAGAGCECGKWSEERRQAFTEECAVTKTFPGLVIAFRGFENEEFDSVLVKEYRDTICLDSFKIFVSPMHDKARKERHASIGGIMDISHTYHMIISGQEPYVLANMKMVMWAQYTMTSEGWGCVMGDYTIDGVRHEHNANPCFYKRGS